MSQKYKPQRVLVTGGGAGIGKRLVERFHERGDTVALCDTDAKAIQDIQDQYPNVIAQVSNVSNEASMDTFLTMVEDALGGIDVVCANAGTGGPAGRIEDLDYQEWQDCIGVNLHGAFLTCRWAARLMRKQESGSIIITSSTSGQWGHPYRSPYSSAKWALVGLTKTLAMELGAVGVRVNAICPGAVEGDRMDRVVEMEAKASGREEKAIREQYVKGVSMRTWVNANDLADTVMFLSSTQASKISGQILAIDGHTETNAP